jgi:hypothetical protein
MKDAHLYRITVTDPARLRDDVRYGTRVRVAAVIRAVKERNAARDDSKKWVEAHPDYHMRPDDRLYQHASVKVERVPIGGWEDVTDQFL